MSPTWSGAPSARLTGAVVLVAVVAWGVGVRVDTAFRQPALGAEGAEVVLKSDPALLYYITQRIVQAGGAPPDDFRADPRVEHPLTSDLPAMFTVGLEFPVAWTYLLLGGALPLVAVCVVVSAVLASLAAVGVYGLAFELAGRVRWAALAALLYALSVSNYRTIAFVLMREDLSLPLFAVHLWLLARAHRLRTPASIALAALAMAAAAATWHAMGFVLALEAVCLFAWFLRSGENPLAARRAWVFPALLALAALAIPVLRAKLFLFSIPMQVTLALLLAATLGRRTPRGEAGAALIGLGAWAALALLALGLTRAVAGEPGDYAHVLDFVASKLRFGGVLPDDPNELSFGARLLWQGPFETGTLTSLVARVGAAGVLLPVALLAAAPIWMRGRGDARFATLAGLALGAVAAGLLVKRLEVLVGLLAPVMTAVLLGRTRPASAAAWIAGLTLVQGATFVQRIGGYTTGSWYPPRYQGELAEVVRWIREELPDEGAIASDFVSSAAILAHTGHAAVLQPKYETRRSRDRIEAFCRHLYRGSPAEFATWLRDELDARYLLVDVQILWPWRYQCGIPRSAESPPEGSAAAALMDPDREALARLADYRLLYTSPAAPHFWRLYEVGRDGPAPP